MDAQHPQESGAAPLRESRTQQSDRHCGILEQQQDEPIRRRRAGIPQRNFESLKKYAIYAECCSRSGSDGLGQRRGRVAAYYRLSAPCQPENTRCVAQGNEDTR